MIGSMLSVRLNMTHPNGCSSPCLTPEIAPPHLGVSPSNQGPVMPFPRYVLCPLFVHSQLYLMPSTLSCPLLLRSIECFRQFSAPVLFLFHSISAKYLVGAVPERLHRNVLVPVSMGNLYSLHDVLVFKQLFFDVSWHRNV
jgi:hypothetical protein